MKYIREIRNQNRKYDPSLYGMFGSQKRMVLRRNAKSVVCLSGENL